MNRRPIIFLTAFLMSAAALLHPIVREPVQAAPAFSFVMLNEYSVTLPVDGGFPLSALTSTGKKPTYKSSNSSVASVNTYGYITAKKAGTCKITAKIKNAEASCSVTVTKTKVTLNANSLTLENGECRALRASVSTSHPVVWKSNRKSIATVSDKGVVSAKKPGSATISASAGGTTVSCKITVKSPSVKLSMTAKTLFRSERLRLSAEVSSKRPVVWKSNKKSVATVDAYGLVTAVKHGTATITATVDGVSKSCTITVAQPVIRLSADSLTLTAGRRATLSAAVSGPNKATWSSSNINVATVDQNGCITARQKGKAYIYACEDGVKVSCIVTVLPVK